MGYSTTDGTAGKGLGSFTPTPMTSISDLNKLLELIARMGNRRVGTEAERDAVTGTALFEGLEWYHTDDDSVYIYQSGWQSLARGSDSRNRSISTDNTFTNPTSPTDFPITADKTALDMSLVKISSDTVLRVSIAVPIYLSSGASQRISAHVNLDGTDYEIASQTVDTAPYRGTLAGVLDIAIGAGTKAIKPRLKSSTAASLVVPSSNRVSYSVEEVLTS